jgi:hypothetical protein
MGGGILGRYDLGDGWVRIVFSQEGQAAEKFQPMNLEMTSEHRYSIHQFTCLGRQAHF